MFSLGRDQANYRPHRMDMVIAEILPEAESTPAHPTLSKPIHIRLFEKSALRQAHRLASEFLARIVQRFKTRERFARPLGCDPDQKRLDEAERGRVHAEHVGTAARHRENLVDLATQGGSERIGQEN